MAIEGAYKDCGYWALIIGGSSGLGWASARQLARQGMNLAVVHRDRKSYLREWGPQWEALADEGVKRMRWNADALQEEQRNKIIEELKERMEDQEQVKVMLHSLSKGSLKAMAGHPALNKADLSITMDAMGLSLYHWAKALKDRELLTSGSRILAFTSAGNQRVWPHYAAVSAAKNALESISQSMAVEWGPEGIRSNVIQAGITDTPSLRMIPGYNDLKAWTERHNPSGRMTQADDVAQAVDLLCRPEADWINGVILPVDGGENNI